jgi:hypothetical protein
MAFTGKEDIDMKKLFAITCIILLIFSFTAIGTYAQEVRRIQPIKSPVTIEEPLAEGVQPVREPVPVDRQIVEKTMQAIANSWNSPDMIKMLGKNFYEKERLIDSMNTKAPVDARLRLLSVGSYRVINQGIKIDSAGEFLISRISVIARTQVEYNDPQNGFQRRQGEQEYIIKITTQKGAAQ